MIFIWCYYLVSEKPEKTMKKQNFNQFSGAQQSKADQNTQCSWRIYKNYYFNLNVYALHYLFAGNAWQQIINLNL